jgi:hypothetical protein
MRHWVCMREFSLLEVRCVGGIRVGVRPHDSGSSGCMCEERQLHMSVYRFRNMGNSGSLAWSQVDCRA